MLRTILDAIRSRSSLEMHYQSFTRPQPKWRRLSPHALGFDGFRWHTRAWCHTRMEFRDFVLARILAVRTAQPSEIDPTGDESWHREITLRIGPHPGLKGGTRKAIELDYGMVNGVVEVTIKVCLASYLERHFGLDRDPSHVPPTRQQIVLLNREEVEAARAASNAVCGPPVDEPDEQRED
jgi:predicted DNA-binding transcriptional regulator YafY